VTVLPFVLRSLEHYHLTVERGFDADRHVCSHWCLTEAGRWFLVEEDRHGRFEERRRLTPSEQRIAETYRPAPTDRRNDIAIVRGDLLPAAELDPSEVLGTAPCLVITFNLPRRRSSSSPPPRLLPIPTMELAPVAPALPVADAASSSPGDGLGNPRDGGGRAPFAALKLVEGGA